jgi:hypothetical protein
MGTGKSSVAGLLQFWMPQSKFQASLLNKSGCHVGSRAAFCDLLIKGGEASSAPGRLRKS